MMSYLREVIQQALDYLKMITVRDVIDILIVAIVLFALFRLLRDTSAMRIIKSVVAIVLILGLAEMLTLQTLTFLMKSTLQVGLIAVVILFQPELRRLLEQLGGASLQDLVTTKAVPENMEQAIGQTVEAVQALSRAREGALIVFERRVRLQDVVNTGTMLDASVTSELMKNIFYPKAPMHDGAVVVREARIAGAGCMLPLTSNPNISKELGMRHRAGIGMSESSDAVVVIVSEETGSISVATDGMLKRHLLPETLEKLLRSMLLPDGGDEKKTRMQRVKEWLRKSTSKGKL